MSEQLTGHDCVPTDPDRDATLNDVLDRMRLQGAVFLRGEYSEAWAYRSPSASDTAALLSPGAARVALFHVVASGRCWVAIEDGEKHWAYAATCSCCRTATSTRWAAPSPRRSSRWRPSSTRRRGRGCLSVRHGAGGQRTDVVCGYLTAIHGSPEQRWTVAGLAREANVSVSLLDERFRAVLKLAPIRYLSAWRMHVAGDLLHSTTLGVAAVARRVGYDSEEAFSRAFKRATGQPPSAARSGARPS